MYLYPSGDMAWASEDQGATWQHHPINVREIGYRGADTVVNPANPLTAIDDPAVDAYTPVYSPASYYTVVATLGYTLRLEKRRELRFDLRVNNVLNDQGPLYSVSTALRPKGGDLTSPARETVANIYAYKQPVSINLSTTLRF